MLPEYITALSLSLSLYIYIYTYVLYQGWGDVNYLTTCIRIGYRVYSLWRLQLRQVTITKKTIAIVASRIPLRNFIVLI
jgi:hypothetical protein